MWHGCETDTRLLRGGSGGYCQLLYAVTFERSQLVFKRSLEIRRTFRMRHFRRNWVSRSEFDVESEDRTSSSTETRKHLNEVYIYKVTRSRTTNWVTDRLHDGKRPSLRLFVYVLVRSIRGVCNQCRNCRRGVSYQIQTMGCEFFIRRSTTSCSDTA